MRALLIGCLLSASVVLACSSGGSGGSGGGGSGGSGGSGGGGCGGIQVDNAGVALHWTLTQGGTSAMCSDFPNASGVEATLTPAGGTNPVTKTFSCSTIQGDVLGLAPGDYTLSVALLDSSSAALLSSDARTVTLGLTGCNIIAGTPCSAGGTCLKEITVDLH